MNEDIVELASYELPSNECEENCCCGCWYGCWDRGSLGVVGEMGRDGLKLSPRTMAESSPASTSYENDAVDDEEENDRFDRSSRSRLSRCISFSSSL
jgi:hypothetical protein